MSDKRRLLIVAGAGSGKTEVMARRAAWWVGVKKVPKENIVAFTFTERAAEEMKLRIRRKLNEISLSDEETSLGGMYVGTIHGFCLNKLREFWPDQYHNYDILEEGARSALIHRSFYNILGMERMREALQSENSSNSIQGYYETINAFIAAYDLLNDNACFDVALPNEEVPTSLGQEETEWCSHAKMITNTGETDSAKAFAESAARYYAYLHCRHFLDFSASQSECVRCLESEKSMLPEHLHLVVDEAQDINPVQKRLIDLLVENSGCLTVVGDHRQAIYAWRGARVEIIADLWNEFKDCNESAIINLQENFRSTPRVVNLANKWSKTISSVHGMATEDMIHGKQSREDHDPSHIALLHFQNDRAAEATWIADAISTLVPDSNTGATHDKRSGEETRGITLSDIAILVRSSTNARDYMRALAEKNIPSIVRAGPDLFSQPEILLFLSALALTADMEKFIGSPRNNKSLPKRIESILGIHDDPITPEAVFMKAANAVRNNEKLKFTRVTEERLLKAAKAIKKRIEEGKFNQSEVSCFRSSELCSFLTSGPDQLRRVFPQRILHMLLEEGEVDAWDSDHRHRRGQSAMFHLGALSGLITGIETPGWTSAGGYRWQIIGLCQYGEQQGRVEEQPLMVQPDAVSVSTIHAAKGLEFAAVFIADVNAQRFPSSMAKRRQKLPLGERIMQETNADSLADNENHDGERRLMYVGLTRSERFLFVSSNSQNQSKFFKELRTMIDEVGGIANATPEQVLQKLRYSPIEHFRDINFATSFSDLRYYFECPHDFYLRKVLGFAPTIDQAFGYGRSVHNLMRSVHSDPNKWASLADNPEQLKKEIRKLINQGLFYLRYTTGEPAENMRRKGGRVVADYIRRHADELKQSSFVPEKPFETVIKFMDDPSAGALVSGEIDLLRSEEPPRVTIIDFKSGDKESDMHKQLSEEQMKLQLGIYALAAKKELEHEPEQGLVRYLDSEDSSSEELKVPLSDKSIEKTEQIVSQAVTKIKDRNFNDGPRPQYKNRCGRCDFISVCGRKEAMAAKQDKK